MLQLFLNAVNNGSGNIKIEELALGGDLTIINLEQRSTTESGTTTVSTLNGNIIVNNSGVNVQGSGALTIRANDTTTDKSITLIQQSLMEQL